MRRSHRTAAKHPASCSTAGRGVCGGVEGAWAVRRARARGTGSVRNAVGGNALRERSHGLPYHGTTSKLSKDARLVCILACHPDQVEKDCDQHHRQLGGGEVAEEEGDASGEAE